MNCLVITNLFPNKNDTNRGLFVKQEIQSLAKLCDIKVIAPVPWTLPLKLNSRWHHYSSIETIENMAQIEVFHPRYLVIPKIGRSLYGFFYFLGIYRIIRKIQKSFPMDVLYVHYAYPDGFGVALVARIVKIPILLKVRGSDINIYSKPFLRKKMIQYALQKAYKIISVSKALQDRMLALGTPLDKLRIVHNGVDNKLFHPIENEKARQTLGITDNKIIILFVGHLVAIKGLHILLEAFDMLMHENELKNQIRLILIGEGDEKDSLVQKCSKLGLNTTVQFVGEQPHTQLPLWFNACNILCLPSLIEGYPNVIVESLACGTSVVASNVGGIPEIITSSDLGILTEPGNSQSLFNGLQRAISQNWDKNKISSSVMNRSWDNVAQETFSLLQEYNKYHD